MPVTISGSTGVQGNLIGNVTGNVTGNASTATLATNATTATVATSASNSVPSSNLSFAACKAWVNFNGAETQINTILNSGGGFGSISVTQGSDQGTWSVTGASAPYIGQVYYIRSIGGVADALLGGRNVSNNGLSTFTQTIGFRIISQTTNSYGIQLLEGPALSSQTISTYTIWVTGIRSGYNISSVIRNDVGRYTVNFVTPFSDAYYTASGMINPSAALGYAFSYLQFLVAQPTYASLGLQASNNGSIYSDATNITAQFFGN